MSLAIIFIWSLSLPAIGSQKPKHQKIENLHDHEISAHVEVQLPLEKIKSARAKWKSCVPQESKKFPEKLSPELSQQIFSDKELQDLKDCKPGYCKHNFLPYEVELLSKIQNEEQLKQQFFHFYQNRVKGLTPIDPRYKALRFSTKENLIPFCWEQPLQNLIQKRPLSDQNAYRLSHIQYDQRMRPTTRLVQGIYFDTKDAVSCYGEALIFSNHYDADRLEVWGLSPDGKLQLLVRHRLDFLHSWWRRMQKPKLQDALADAASRQIVSALQCLQSD